MYKSIETLIDKIANKEFTFGQQGYAPSEVDHFLNSICDDLDLIEQEVQELSTKIQVLETGALTSTPSIIEHTANMDTPVDYEEDEVRQVVDIVKMAKQMYDETMNSARKKADAIINNAVETVNSKNVDIYAEGERLKVRVQEMKEQVSHYKLTLSNFVETTQAMLGNIQEEMNDEEI